MNIIWKGSPNFAKRTKPVKKIVIHWFGVGTLEAADKRFQNSINRVSAHYGISKGRIWQWVKEDNVAWHAGNSAMNAETIGIEHDATLNDHNLSEGDYALSAALVREISKRHNIPLDRAHIIGHREIKATQCPGTIDIDKIINLAKKSMSNVKIVQKEGSKELGFYLPIASPQALVSAGANYGFEIPLDPKGNVDFSKLNIDGSVKLSK